MEDEDEINIPLFLKARSAEIKQIEESILKNRKKSMLFQRLPFHKRRRNKSYKTRPFKKRKSGMHAWFAKRNKMIEFFGVKMPLKTNCKTDSYIYKSFKRGFIFYKNFGEKCLVIYGDCDFFKGDAIYSLIDNVLVVSESENCFQFKRGVGLEVGRLYIKDELVMDVFQRLIIMGLVPISIENLLRIGMERKCLIDPFDIVATDFYNEFEDALIKIRREKWERTPKSKRMENDPNLLKFKKLGNYSCFFEIEKGIADRCSEVVRGGEIVGYVLRSCYSFSCGKGRGIAYLIDDNVDNLSVRKLSSGEYLKINVHRETIRVIE